MAIEAIDVFGPSKRPIDLEAIDALPILLGAGPDSGRLRGAGRALGLDARA